MVYSIQASWRLDKVGRKEELRMAIERWSPFATSLERWEPFRDVLSEVNRLFDSFFGRPTAVVTGTGSRVWMPALDRSEEHTSELQSRSDLVCRLLLEKKK